MCHILTLLCLFQGFSDTSLSVGKAAAVLRNYERRTGQTLSREDLQGKNLAAKLTPADYDLKSQVPHPFPYPFWIISLLDSPFAMSTLLFVNLQVTLSSTTNRFSSMSQRLSSSAHPNLEHPLLFNGFLMKVIHILGRLREEGSYPGAVECF